MIKKFVSLFHVVFAFVACGFLGKAFVEAIIVPQMGAVEYLIVAATCAIASTICRDVSK